MQIKKWYRWLKCKTGKHERNWGFYSFGKGTVIFRCLYCKHLEEIPLDDLTEKERDFVLDLYKELIGWWNKQN